MCVGRQLPSQLICVRSSALLRVEAFIIVRRYIYGAFFPQFVALDRHVGSQVVLLSITFLAVAVLVDGAWALIASRARGVLAARGRLRNRVSGGFLIGAGAALALARNK